MVKKDEVKKVAKLAKLEFSDAEFAQLTSELNGVLGYIDQLKEVDVTGIASLENVNEAVETSSFRADVVTPSLTRDEALQNAPRSADGYYLVPKVIEQQPKAAATSRIMGEEDEEVFE